MSPRFVLGWENVPCVAEVVNRSLKADCTDLLFHIGRKSFVENKWLWLHTTRKSLLGLPFMIDNQTV